jgi:hypothetical protein
MSDVPGSTAGPPFCGENVTNINLTFDDQAAAGIPDMQALAAGTYKPTNDDTNQCGTGNPDAWPSPAPAPPYGSTLSAFTGTDPNGTWRLFIVDDTSGDTGMLGGWSLDITTSNDISFGKLKKNKDKGTAVLSVNVPGPGTLTLGGTGVKPQRHARLDGTVSKAVTSAGVAKLKVKAKGAKKKKLLETGKVKVKLKVTFTPTGGAPKVETRRAKLIDRD